MFLKPFLAFLLGGAICVVAQILIDKTKLTPARILVSYVVFGVFLGAIGLYKPIFEIFGCGISIPLVGFGGNIANGVKEAVVERFAKEIHKNAKRLLTLINDIIKLSELDAIENSIYFEKVDLYDMAETCVNMLQVNAEKHSVNLFFRGTPCTITANKDMIEELMYNLCDNAIRYNVPGGNVWMEVKEEAENVILRVRDTGIGISKEHQERIFERFYRVDKSRSKSTGGTGLGLAIVKHIVAKHEAKVELNSEVGKGTIITVYFEK